MAQLIVRIAALVATLATAGCNGCDDDEPAVPFKRVEAVATTAPEATAPARTDAGVVDTAFVPSVGRIHPEGTTEVSLGAGRVSVADGSLRASLEIDLDANGALDGLFLISHPGAAPTLGSTMAGDKGLGQVQSSASLLDVDPACSVRSARLASIARSLVLASAELECPGAVAADAGVAAGASAQVQAHHWLVGVEPAPRALEHLWRRLDEVELSMTVRSAEADGDGHDDVLVALELGGSATGESARFELTWLNRPSGLGREPSQPEKALLERANQARAALKKEPARAAALARETLRLHGLLCMESGTAALHVGHTRGIACGASTAAGRAAAVLASALAASGQVFETLRALDALESPAYQVASADAQRARDAASQLPRVAGVTWTPGPRLPASGATGVQRARFAFLDEEHLLLRGSPPLSYSIVEATSAVTSQDSEQRLLSPDGKLALAAIFRACDGYHLQVLDAQQLVQGLAMGASKAEPLLWPAPAPPGARCPGTLGRSLREDTGGFQVLDWLERGVLLARDEERWLLRVGATGAAEGAAVLIGSNEALAPRAPGALSADGSRYARVSPVGVVRITLGASLQSELLPDVPGEGTLSDAVVSPSGAAVAVLRGTQVYVARVALGAGAGPSTRTTTSTGTSTSTSTTTSTNTGAVTNVGASGTAPGEHHVDLPAPPEPPSAP